MAVSMITDEKYHCLFKYSVPVKAPQRELIGREKELRQVRAGLERPELCNVMLLGEAGTGKSALVSGLSQLDSDRLYLEVDLAKMIANCQTDIEEVAGKLKSLFDDTERYVQQEHTEVILFMDEFHQIVQMSDSAVEAMKPLLANSGRRGIRIIGATTPAEFRKYISPNQPLVERLQRINLSQTNHDTTIAILKSMAETYGVTDDVFHESLYEMIYEYTNRYIPANAQPRKSILVLDAMIGWHKSEGRVLNKKLLADVIYESEGINVAFHADANRLRESLDKVVLAQKYATFAIEKRLQVCIADLNAPRQPMATLLFSGPTGCGKTAMAKALAKLLFDDDRSLIRMDMTEYANPDSLERFRKELTNRVWEHPYSVILLDEIEKACAEVTRILLQVLDDGRLIDENNREVTFINSYIIMTTNAGNEIYKNIAQYNADDEGMGNWIKDYTNLIRKSLTETTGGNKFPPELLGRVTPIPFQPLSINTQYEIARMQLKELRNRVRQQHGCNLVIANRVLDYIVKDNLSVDADSGGARAVMAKLDSEVISEVARFLNTNPGCYQARIDVEGVMASEDKNRRVSKAKVVVKPYDTINRKG